MAESRTLRIQVGRSLLDLNLKEDQHLASEPDFQPTSLNVGIDQPVLI